MSEQRKVLHIEAGSADWDPSEEEMQMLVQLFHDATIDGDAVLATRRGVTARVVDVSEVKDIVITRAVVETPPVPETTPDID